MISKCSAVLPTPILWARAVQIIWQLSQRADGGWPAFSLAFLQQNFPSKHLGYVNLVSPCPYSFFFSLPFFFAISLHCNYSVAESKASATFIPVIIILIEGIEFLRVSPIAQVSSLSDSVRRSSTAFEAHRQALSCTDGRGIRGRCRLSSFKGLLQSTYS